MPPEKRVFEIAERQATKQLAPGGNYVFVFDVTNNDERARTAGVELIFEEGAPEDQQQWFSVGAPAGTDTERIPFQSKQTREVQVKIAVPANADTKDYKARLLVWDIEQKADVFTEGNWVTTQVRKEPVPDPKPKPNLLWLWIALGAVGLAGIVVLVILLWPDRTAPVPDVITLSLEDATARLAEVGFAEVTHEDVVSGAEAGIVVDQKPPGDTEQKKSEPVHLLVEAPLVAVPNVVGKTPEEAQKLLPPDLQVAVRGQKYGSHAGTILTQDPPEGTMVRKDTVINVETDLGPAPPVPVNQEQRCADLVQGKIGWDSPSNTSWAGESVSRLCRGTSAGDQPPSCFDLVMRGGISWGPSTVWNPVNALKLCAGTGDARSTILCFQNRIRGGSSWPQAIDACDRLGGRLSLPTAIGVARARPIAGAAILGRRGAPETVPDTPESVCYDLVQGKIAWNDAGSNHWNRADIERLCAGTADGAQPSSCFDRVMHGGVVGPSETKWHWTDVVDLCEGTDDASATIACLQENSGPGKTKRAAIEACQRH